MGTDLRDRCALFIWRAYMSATIAVDCRGAQACLLIHDAPAHTWRVSMHGSTGAVLLPRAVESLVASRRALSDMTKTVLTAALGRLCYMGLLLPFRASYHTHHPQATRKAPAVMLVRVRPSQAHRQYRQAARHSWHYRMSCEQGSSPGCDSVA